MTIHTTHPFADADRDPVRRFRARLSGAVSLWTTGTGGAVSGRAGLTVSSLMVANGEPPQVLGLIDPDSDLADAVADALTSDSAEPARVLVQLLAWRHRDLAEVFAGLAPAPGGAFAQAEFTPTRWGPLLAGVTAYAGVRVTSAATVGWSTLLTCELEEVVVGDDDAAGVAEGDEPLGHRRGRYLRLGS